MLTVITGWSPRGWHEYGQNFVRTFSKHWPKTVKLVVYTEEPQEFGMSNVECRIIWDIPLCKEFIDKWRDDKRANGRLPTEKWKPKFREKGYNYKFDAWKFSRQGFIPYHAAMEMREGMLCWLDGDVTTFRDVPEGLVESLLPDDKNVAFLGRGEKHSEIGFQLYRVPHAFKMLSEFYRLYATEDVFKLKEWHSAYVFDTARKVSEIAGHDLTPSRDISNVWQISALAGFSDHLKGERKGRLK